MKSKIWLFVFVFIFSVGIVETFLTIEKKKFIHQCEKLAMDWIHEQGLDESDVVDFDINTKRESAHFYDLRNDGNEELVMAFAQNSVPKPGSNEDFPHDTGLLYFVFQKTDPILFENIFKAGLWDGNVLKDEQLLKFKKGFPNLLCVYDGMSDAPGGEPTGEIKGHVFMMTEKALREVLVYNALNVVRQAPPGYTSRISLGEGRNLVVDYSIPVRSPDHGYNEIGEKHKKIIYEWNERLRKYRLQKGSPTYIEPFYNEN